MTPESKDKKKVVGSMPINGVPANGEINGTEVHSVLDDLDDDSWEWEEEDDEFEDDDDDEVIYDDDLDDDDDWLDDDDWEDGDGELDD